MSIYVRFLAKGAQMIKYLGKSVMFSEFNSVYSFATNLWTFTSMPVVGSVNRWWVTWRFEILLKALIEYRFINSCQSLNGSLFNAACKGWNHGSFKLEDGLGFCLLDLFTLRLFKLLFRLVSIWLFLTLVSLLLHSFCQQLDRTHHIVELATKFGPQPISLLLEHGFEKHPLSAGTAPLLDADDALQDQSAKPLWVELKIFHTFGLKKRCTCQVATNALVFAVEKCHHSPALSDIGLKFGEIDWSVKMFIIFGFESHSHLFDDTDE